MMDPGIVPRRKLALWNSLDPASPLNCRANNLCHVPARASPEGQALQVVQQLRHGI
ncbi:unnamed protein product [Ectocarpus sp. 12 AP-2014]